ncbi:putative endonuclease lcl3 [Agyrium rufum]|nr:putative endonuclease lcl3 [Agyrium rufum]
MRWPSWSTESAEDKKKAVAPTRTWEEALTTPQWRQWIAPDTIIPTFILTATILASFRVYRRYLRQIPTATKISDSFWRKRSLFGTVTSVGDGDGFRLFHTPGGLMTGWGWFRRVPEGRALKDKTISVRIAGVDAPEGAHFGRPAQPGAQEALDWLTSYILHRRVRTYVFRKDQYDRAVGSVYVRRWLLRRDVGLEMLKRGLATVYEAKTGSEFGKLEDRYRRAEQIAQRKRKGIWAAKGKDFESPRDYKNRVASP